MSAQGDVLARHRKVAGTWSVPSRGVAQVTARRLLVVARVMSEQHDSPLRYRLGRSGAPPYQS